MTHEEYLSSLITGFAGEPSVRRPHYGGANEEDAVCRWLSYHVAQHELERGGFELDERGRMLSVAIQRVWAQWRRRGTEDVDITISGLRGGAFQSANLKACVTLSRESYLLRISDWSTRRNVDVEGVRRNEPHGGVRIATASNPMLWTMPSTPRAAPTETTATDFEDLDSIPDCCRRTLNQIARVLESGGHLAEMLALAPSLVNLGRTPRPGLPGILWKLGTGGRRYASQRAQMRRLTDAIVRERVQTLIRLELLDHDAASPLGVIWTNLLEMYE